MSADVCWCQVNFEIFAKECNTFISNAAISACEKGPLTSPLTRSFDGRCVSGKRSAMEDFLAAAATSRGA